jgi:hypothetical protein
MTLWWLLTWRTYGSWLPGDPRGFRTWRRREYVPPPREQAESGEPIYNPGDYTERYAAARERLTAPAVCLTLADRRKACSALVAEIGKLQIVPAILAVAESHVHFISQFGELRIRRVAGRLKAAATIAIKHQNSTEGPVWGTGSHMKSLYAEDDFVSAFRYVEQHEGEGAVVHKWDSNIDWKFDR